MNVGADCAVLRSRLRGHWERYLGALLLVAVSPLLWQTHLAVKELRQEQREDEAYYALEQLIESQESVIRENQLWADACDARIGDIRDEHALKCRMGLLRDAEEKRLSAALIDAYRRNLDAARDLEDATSDLIDYMEKSISLVAARDIALHQEALVIQGDKAERRGSVLLYDLKVDIPHGLRERSRLRIRHLLRERVFHTALHQD